MAKRWYALFSHTGEEIKNIVDITRALPERIWTNNMVYNGALSLPWYSREGLMNASSAVINHYLCDSVERNSVVTLNGYMRIIPAKVIERCHERNIRILNIHPAPIEEYPELRGKDPQERLYQGIIDGKYKKIGVVIHEVDAGVDTGKIVRSCTEDASVVTSLNDLYRRLHDMGTEMWCTLFKEGLLDG